MMETWKLSKYLHNTRQASSLLLQGKMLAGKVLSCPVWFHNIKWGCLLFWSIGNSTSGFFLSKHCHVPHAKEQISSEISSVLFLDILSSTIIKKPKFSSLEKIHLPSEINHALKKTDSIEEEVEIQKGKIWLVTKVKCLNSLSFSFLVVEVIVTWKLEEMYL